MKKVIMGIGIPGAGKTTLLQNFAEKYDYGYICPDDIRKELTGNAIDQTRNREVWEEAYTRTRSLTKIYMYDKVRAEGETSSMEIWKVGTTQVTDAESSYWWAKKSFRIKKSRRAVTNFFKSSLPSLCQMVLEELQKNDGQRWIVFSQIEEARIFEIGKVFVNPAENTVSVLFLHCILTPVRESCRKGFSVTYVREDNPEKSPLVKDTPLRLAILISE